MTTSVRRASAAVRTGTVAAFLLWVTAAAGSEAAGPLKGDHDCSVAIQRPAGASPGAVLAVFHAEVAADSLARGKGLSGRDSLPGDHAMLFPLDEAPTAFWMNGMRFPIDILFFDRSMSLISAVKGLSPCDRCELHPAPSNAAYALEINAGLTDALGLLPGDMLLIVP